MCVVIRIEGVQLPQIAGSWNVTSISTADYTCKGIKPGDTQAYIWIVSSRTDGTVSISVQGETSFPKLEGYWSRDLRTLTLGGGAVGLLASNESWLKLSAESPGVLHGVRRVLMPNQSINGRMCFADFEITAKKQ